MLTLCLLLLATNPPRIKMEDHPRSIYDFTMKSIDGKEVPLSRYKGKVLLVVNVASKCGYTPQYEGLQKLFRDYEEKGLVVLGFPANNFGGQEPGSNKDIQQFCQTEYGVTFDMFEKISVKGADKHPLYQYLTSAKTNGEIVGDIGWNFEKFLIGKNGEILGRYDKKVEPLSEQLVRDIKKALAP
ncbi:MAG TPA: glutathione peroxidase [Bacteroidota bacterium]|jgi:glutathione peroxidase